MAVDFIPGDFITIPNSSLLSPGTGNISIAVWVFPDNVGANAKTIYNDYGLDLSYVVALSQEATNGDFNAAIRDGLDALASATATGYPGTAGVWYHVASTWDGAANSLILYVDGIVRATSGTVLGTVITSDGALPTLGVYGPDQVSNTFDGRLEDFRIGNVVWTPKQVAALAAGYRGPLGGEVLWLSMRDFRGIAHPDGSSLAGANILPDLSSSGLNGTPVNSPIARASEAPRYLPWSYAYASMLSNINVLQMVISNSG